MNSNFFSNLFKSRFFREEDGQTLVEYGLLISLLALVVVAIVGVFGKRVGNMFNNAGNQFP